MNNGASKVRGQYQTGDLIYRASSLGSPGPGWLNMSTTNIISATSPLGSLLPAGTTTLSPISSIPTGYTPWIKT